MAIEKIGGAVNKSGGDADCLIGGENGDAWRLFVSERLSELCNVRAMCLTATIRSRCSHPPH